MGWWLAKLKSGRIDFKKTRAAHGAGKLANAVPGQNGPDGPYVGDGPADIMGAALDRIAEEYFAVWNRPPTFAELRATFAFVTGPIKEGNVVFDANANRYRVVGGAK